MPKHCCLILLALMGNLLSTTLYGQVVRREWGAVYSPKEIGLTYTSTSFDGNPWLMAKVVADMMDVVKGETGIPGVRGACSIAYPLKTWKSLGGTVLDVVAGPGAVLGLVKDHGASHFSALAGLEGMVGSYYHLTSGVVLGISFSAELGLCFSAKDAHNTRLSYWKHGIYQALIPEISIAYGF